MCIKAIKCTNCGNKHMVLGCVCYSHANNDRISIPRLLCTHCKTLKEPLYGVGYNDPGTKAYHIEMDPCGTIVLSYSTINPHMGQERWA
jgi:hydrogenase maturation factor HypF (carbamoyltransferase family)